MKTTIKAAVVAFGALGALAIPASAQPTQNDPYNNAGYGPYDQGYAPQQGYPQNYPGAGYDQPYPQGYPDSGYGPGYDQDYAQGADCDPYYGCPDDYADLPLYDGEVYYGGGWLNGPFYYRDFGGGRQFWLHGGWHSGNYRGGNFRQARGGDFYRNHGFAGRSFHTGGNFGGQNIARQAFRPQQNVQPQPFAGNRGFRSFAQNPQGFGGGHNWNRQNFQPQGGGGGWRGHAQAQPQQNGGGHGGGGWHHH